MKVTTKKMIHPGLYVMECPKCGDYVASGCEYSILPEFVHCPCDGNVIIKKLPTKEVKEH